MKKIVGVLPESKVVNVRDVKSDDYVGIKWSDGSRTHVCKIDDDLWTDFGFSSNGSYIRKICYCSIWELLDSAIREGADAYVFESEKALSNWVNEQYS